MAKKKVSFSLKVKRWLFFGVVLSLLAIILSVIYDLILGYNLNQIKIDCAPDFLLVIFAVAANVMSLITDNEKQMSNEDRFSYGCISGITLLLYIAFYSFGFKAIDNAAPVILNILFFISIPVLIINIYIGILIES